MLLAAARLTVRSSEMSKKPMEFSPLTKTELTTTFCARRTPICGTMSPRLNTIRLTTSPNVMLLVTSLDLPRLEVTLKRDSLSSELNVWSTTPMISVTIEVVSLRREEELLEALHSDSQENSTSLQFTTSLKNIIKTPNLLLLKMLLNSSITWTLTSPTSIEQNHSTLCTSITDSNTCRNASSGANF